MSFNNSDQVFGMALPFINSAIHQAPQCVVFPNTFLLDLVTIGNKEKNKEAHSFVILQLSDKGSDCAPS